MTIGNTTPYSPSPGPFFSLSRVAFLKSIGLWLPLLLAGLRANGQLAIQPMPIVLQPPPGIINTREFHIAEVVDDRPNKAAVAYLLSVVRASSPLAFPYSVDLQGGTLKAIREFVQQRLPGNPRQRPLILRIKSLRVTESEIRPGNVDGQIVVLFGLDLKDADGNIHLTDYQGGASYTRTTTQYLDPGPALSQSLNSALLHIQGWMHRQLYTNEKLARELRITFTDYVRNDQPDTVFYDPSRPITWQDFRAERTKPSPYAASIYPSFAYEGDRKVINGVIHLNLTMKVFMLPGSSWVKPDAKDDYGLNHEQRHFDLVKLVVERFKQRIHPDSLTVRHYDSMIQYRYIEAFREMNRRQEQYDSETKHGLDGATQQRWNEEIDAALRRLGIRKEE